jgi:hypothetical protein
MEWIGTALSPASQPQKLYSVEKKEPRECVNHTVMAPWSTLNYCLMIWHFVFANMPHSGGNSTG